MIDISLVPMEPMVSWGVCSWRKWVYAYVHSLPRWVLYQSVLFEQELVTAGLADLEWRDSLNILICSKIWSIESSCVGRPRIWGELARSRSAEESSLALSSLQSGGWPRRWLKRSFRPGYEATLTSSCSFKKWEILWQSVNGALVRLRLYFRGSLTSVWTAGRSRWSHSDWRWWDPGLYNHHWRRRVLRYILEGGLAELGDLEVSISS